MTIKYTELHQNSRGYKVFAVAMVLMMLALLDIALLSRHSFSLFWVKIFLKIAEMLDIVRYIRKNVQLVFS